MKKILSTIVFSLLFAAFCGSAWADSVVASYNCELKDGKTSEELQAANSKWLKFVNANVEGGGITSSIGTAVVGNSEIFMFVDTYPSLSMWAKVKEMLDSEDGDPYRALLLAALARGQDPREALGEAGALIVVCSPAASAWPSAATCAS